MRVKGTRFFSVCFLGRFTSISAWVPRSEFVWLLQLSATGKLLTRSKLLSALALKWVVKIVPEEW